MNSQLLNLRLKLTEIKCILCVVNLPQFLFKGGRVTLTPTAVNAGQIFSPCKLTGHHSFHHCYA